MPHRKVAAVFSTLLQLPGNLLTVPTGMREVTGKSLEVQAVTPTDPPRLDRRGTSGDRQLG